MEILLQDLLPGQEYLLQLRSKNQQGVSQWSRAYAITTDSDVVSPSPITGLSWVVSGTSFVGSWTKPTTDSDGEDLRDFRDFKVTLTADASTAVFYVTEERFDLSLERNIGLFGSPKPTVSIKVEARDTIGNLSSPVTASASNPIPSDVAGLSLTPILGGINVRWTKNDDDDFKKYELYSSTTSSSFTPSSSNLRYSGAGNAFVYTIGNTSTVYFKLRAVDVFDQPSANYATGSTSAYPIDGVPDTTAPSQPSAPVISLGALVAQVSHNMTKQAGGSLESDVDYLEIHASATTDFTPSDSTLRGTINSAGVGIPVSAAFYFPSTDSMTNLYWKVIAVDKSKNKSTSSPQTIGLPGLIENANILNATITDAKIQNLSAAKLIAGTAIINDLFVEATLTVNDTGSVQSENYVAGVSGWRIAADGSVEFNGGVFRGDLHIGTATNFVFAEYDTPPGPGARVGVEDEEGNWILLSSTTNGGPHMAIYEAFADQTFEVSANSDGLFIGNSWNGLEPNFGTRNGNGVYFNGGETGRDILVDSETGFLMSGNAQPWSEEGWKTLPGNNGWSGGLYKEFPDGTVMLEGNISGGTQTTGITIGTLPSGYRPIRSHEFMVARSGAYGVSKVTIMTNGSILYWTNDGVWNGYLSGIKFSTI